VVIDDGSGVLAVVASAVVEVRDVTDPGAIVRLLPDLLADTAGHVDSASLNVDAGSVIRFTWKDDATGLCGFAEQVSV